MHPGVTRSLRLLGMPGRQEDNWGSSQRKVVKIVYRQTTLIPDDNYGTKTIRESRVDGLLLAVVAVGVGAATVAVVDEAGGGHPEGLHRAQEQAQDTVRGEPTQEGRRAATTANSAQAPAGARRQYAPPQRTPLSRSSVSKTASWRAWVARRRACSSRSARGARVQLSPPK
jgi:hypothetical protein